MQHSNEIKDGSCQDEVRENENKANDPKVDDRKITTLTMKLLSTLVWMRMMTKTLNSSMSGLSIYSSSNDNEPIMNGI